MRIAILNRLKYEFPFHREEECVNRVAQQAAEPSSPGIEGSYQDMWPGGMTRGAELTFDNLTTLNTVIGAMRTVDRRRERRHHEERRQSNLIDMLEKMAVAHWEDPRGASLTLVEEPARQTRRFIAEAAQGNIEGLRSDATQDMQFLDVIMLDWNQHPPQQAGQPLDPKPGENPYVTEDWHPADTPPFAL